MSLPQRLLILLAASALAGHATVAAAELPSGLYVAGDIGRAQIGYTTSTFIDAQQSAAAPFGNLDLTHYSLHKRADAWWASGGYMGSAHVGVEAAFLHLGELTYRVWGSYTPTGGSAESATFVESLRSDGPALLVVFRLPLAEGLDLRLRAGDYYGRTTLTTGRNVVGTIKYAPVTTTARSSALLLGLGAGYTFDGHWSARLDYLRVNQAGDAATTGRYSVDLATIGASYAF